MLPTTPGFASEGVEVPFQGCVVPISKQLIDISVISIPVAAGAFAICAQRFSSSHLGEELTDFLWISQKTQPVWSAKIQLFPTAYWEVRIYSEGKIFLMVFFSINPAPA